KNLPAQSPYGDIKTDDPRFPVVMWARQRGITWGWSDGNFHYDAPAGEKTTVLMAYRLAGSPKVKLQDKSSILAPETWETYYPNMPHGSELHYAYTWALYGSWDLEQDAKYLTYRGIGLANKAPYWDSMWTHDATYEQAFEVLRLADTRGIF
ncbi:MAG: S-layer homology domain-containing protein, partial [Rothia mucilaginosa]